MLRDIWKYRNVFFKEKQVWQMGLLIVPTGWARQNQAAYNDVMQKLLLPEKGVKTQHINVAAQMKIERWIKTLPSNDFTNMMASSLSTYPGILEKFAEIQTAANEAFIACAIERYRLAHGALPQKLSDLSQPPPHDLINGKPLHYRLTGNGGYTLYSVGWNQKDDGGKVGWTKFAGFNRTQGDWVFSLTANASSGM